MCRLSIAGVAEARTTGMSSNLAAHHRDVAGVILDAVLLLEARLVRLVDDDQAELGIGQEQAPSGRRP
jgi:hypothetical protein